MTVAPVKTSGTLPRWVGYLTKPVLLGLACLALYLWVSGLELDSIEQRELNAETYNAALYRAPPVDGRRHGSGCLARPSPPECCSPDLLPAGSRLSW
jgi:hypothetical protein